MKHFDIRVRLIGGVLVVFALLMAVFAISLNGLNQIGAAADRIVHEALPEDKEITDLEFQLAYQTEEYIEYALTLDEVDLQEARETTDIIIAEAAQLEEQLAGEPELLRLLTQFQTEYEEFLREAERFAAFYAEGDKVRGEKSLRILEAEEDQMEAVLAHLASEIELGIEESFRSAERAHTNAALMMGAASIVATIVTLGLTIYLSKIIFRLATLRDVLRQRAALAEMGRIVSSTLDINEIYEKFAEQVRWIIPHDRIAIELFEGDGEHLRTVFTDGMEIPGRGQGKGTALDGSFAGETLNLGSGTIFNLNEPWISAELGLARKPALEAGVRTFICTPLVVNGEAIGALYLNSVEPDAYNEEHLHIAEQVGSEIAGAVANSRLHTDLLRDANQRAVLAEIGRIASSSLHLSDDYERITDQVHKLISFDKATVFFVNEEEGTMEAAFSSGLNVAERPIGKIESIRGSVANEAFQSATAKLVQTEDEAWFAEHYPVTLPSYKAGLKSIMSLPLFSDNKVIGALSISSLTSNAYGPRDIAVAEQIAMQLAGAVASSRYHMERQRAEVALGESTELYGLCWKAHRTASF